MDEIAKADSKRVKKKSPTTFQKGNKLWMARTQHGSKMMFENPEILWKACKEYFEWVEANPLYEDRPFHYQGSIKHENVPKMRAMTLSGLSLFLNIGERTWALYRSRDEFKEVCARAEKVIYNQKFAGASADLLNASIIAREIGLSEKTEHTGPDGGPFKIVIAQADADLL